MIIRGEDGLERLQADGVIGVEDADEVRTFIAFLRDAPPHADRETPEGRAKLRAALGTHYPDQYPEFAPHPEETP